MNNFSKFLNNRSKKVNNNEFTKGGIIKTRFMPKISSETITIPQLIPQSDTIVPEPEQKINVDESERTDTSKRPGKPRKSSGVSLKPFLPRSHPSSHGVSHQLYDSMIKEIIDIKPISLLGNVIYNPNQKLVNDKTNHLNPRIYHLPMDISWPKGNHPIEIGKIRRWKSGRIDLVIMNKPVLISDGNSLHVNPSELVVHNNLQNNQDFVFIGNSNERYLFKYHM